ncbi:hypothetical protein DFH06DRAFT_612669 [Mycena polygramma]|nr:hypothetical protein DFH06DRAFT_612669 [Mycena polygramma]
MINLLPHLLLLNGFTVSYATPAVVSEERKALVIRWVDCHNKLPDELAPALNLTGTTFPGPIPSNLFCGEIDIPMDYTKPFNAATNNITIGLAMNRPPNPKRSSGLIFYHPGGPGENAATQAWVNALGLDTSFKGLENFDFLAINARGVQFSNPLNLSSGVFYNNMSFAFPSNEAEFKQYQAATTNFYNAAIRDTKPAGVMQHLGTVEIIQDWDAVRAALGYEKVHSAALSFGSFVAAAYAARYPHRVDRFLIDAVIPHGMGVQDIVTFQIGAANRLVQRADAFCLNDPACPFHGQGNGSVVKAWQTVLANAIKAPLPALSCGPGTGCNAPVTATDMRQGLGVLLRVNPDFPLFIKGLNASLHGDASIFAYQPQFDFRESPVAPLLCSDMEIDAPVKKFAGYYALAANARASGHDPLNIIYSQIWQVLVQCTVWPYPVPKRTTLPTDLKIMWMTSDFDLNLPTEMTTFAWKLAPKSTLVIRHGDDHTSMLTPAPASAANDIGRKFLLTGVMPGPRSDANITIVAPGGTRPPVPGAYDVHIGAIAGDVSSIENIV